MLSFLIQRLLQIVPTLILVSMLIFGLQQLLPGDPALIMAGEERDPKVLQEIREQYKLDQPIPVKYVYWMKGVLSGNLGESMRLKASVGSLVREKLPVTLQLAVMALLIAVLIGIPAGIVSAGINAFYTQLCFGLVIVVSVVLQTIIERRVRRQSITGRCRTRLFVMTRMHSSTGWSGVTVITGLVMISRTSVSFDDFPSRMILRA